jgi:hypothetical protein
VFQPYSKNLPIRSQKKKENSKKDGHVQLTILPTHPKKSW